MVSVVYLRIVLVLLAALVVGLGLSYHYIIGDAPARGACGARENTRLHLAPKHGHVLHLGAPAQSSSSIYEARMESPLGWVHAVRVLSPEVAQWVRNEADKHANRRGGWRINLRHPKYATTDIEVKHNAQLAPWFHKLFRNRIGPLIMNAYFPKGGTHLAPYDIFVVRYDATQQNRLEAHRDASVISFNLALNEDFEGGGTYIDALGTRLTMDTGTLLLHCGRLRHCGCPVTRGVRYILVGFVLVKSRHIPQKLVYMVDRQTGKLGDDLVLQGLHQLGVTPPPIERHIAILPSEPQDVYVTTTDFDFQTENKKVNATTGADANTPTTTKRKNQPTQPQPAPDPPAPDQPLLGNTRVEEKDNSRKRPDGDVVRLN